MYEFYYFYLVYGEPDRSEFLQLAIALGGSLYAQSERFQVRL